MAILTQCSVHVTKRRDGEARRGNQKLEQETPEGTHMRTKRSAVCSMLRGSGQNLLLW